MEKSKRTTREREREREREMQSRWVDWGWDRDVVHTYPRFFASTAYYLLALTCNCIDLQYNNPARRPTIPLNVGWDAPQATNFFPFGKTYLDLPNARGWKFAAIGFMITLNDDWFFVFSVPRCRHHCNLRIAFSQIVIHLSFRMFFSRVYTILHFAIFIYKLISNKWILCISTMINENIS